MQETWATFLILIPLQIYINTSSARQETLVCTNKTQFGQNRISFFESREVFLHLVLSVTETEQSVPAIPRHCRHEEKDCAVARSAFNLLRRHKSNLGNDTSGI